MFKFWKRQEPEEYVLEPRKRGRETLAQTAEKIIQRKMKKDPDGYGLEAAEKLKGMRHPEPKTVSDFLRELKEYRQAMREAGLESEGKENMLSLIVKTAGDIIGPVIQQKMLEAQGTTQVVTEMPPSIEEKPKQPSLPQPEPKRQPKQEQPGASLSELVGYLDYEPQDIIADLVERYNNQDTQAALWLGVLGGKSYDEVIALLQPLAGYPEFASVVEELMSEDRREWLEKLLELAKQSYLELKNAQKQG